MIKPVSKADFKLEKTIGNIKEKSQAQNSKNTVCDLKSYPKEYYLSFGTSKANLKKTILPAFVLCPLFIKKLKKNSENEDTFNKSYENFWLHRNDKVEHNVDDVIKSGDLIHGYRDVFDLKKFESILKNGIMSGEIGLPGEKQIIPEDAETHGCADFFIAPENTNIKTYFNEFIGSFMPYGKNSRIKHPEFNYLPKHSYLSKSSHIGFIVDKEKFSKSCPELWENSATPETLKGSKLENIISHFPDYRYHRAVLVGVPSNYISKIVVGDGVDKDKIASMKALLDKYNLSAKIYDLDGNVL